MSARAAERVERLLSVIPWIIANPGRTVAEVAEHFDVPEDELRTDLKLVFVEVGVEPFTPDTMVDIIIDEEDDTVEASSLALFSRPLRLSPEEGLRLLAAGRAVLGTAEVDFPALRSAVEALAGVVGVGPGAVDVQLGAADPEVLSTVREALGTRHGLELTYWSSGRDEVTGRTVDPLRLEHSGGHWYLQAHCHLAGAVRVFRLDRVAEVRSTGETFEAASDPPPLSFDAADADRTIDVVVGPEQAWVVDTYPVLAVEDLGDGRRRVRLGVTARAWLQRLLLRLGPDVEVTDGDTGEPLRRELAAAADRVLVRYR